MILLPCPRADGIFGCRLWAGGSVKKRQQTLTKKREHLLSFL